MPAPPPRPQFDFLLLPEFSFIGFAALLEPLRIANRYRPGAYQWRLLSMDGQPVAASNGIALHPQARLGDGPVGTVLFAIASFHPLRHYTAALGRHLRLAAQQGCGLGAIDTGCYVLAEAGLLQGASITLHWEAIAAFRERYPGIAVQDQARYTLAPGRMTSAGGTASVDLMLAVIAQDLGREVALQVSEQLVSGWVRERGEHQRLQVSTRYRVHNAKVVRAISLMEQNLEDPLTSEVLARPMGITRRQLERLFQEHMDCSPVGFYLRLRLERARYLLRQSSMSIIDIGLACGFASASAFSRAYRRAYGVAPRDDREETGLQRATAPAATPWPGAS